MMLDLITEGKTEARIFGTNENKGCFVLDEDKIKWYGSTSFNPDIDEPKAETLVMSTYTGTKKSKSKTSPKRRRKSTKK